MSVEIWACVSGGGVGIARVCVLSQSFALTSKNSLGGVKNMRKPVKTVGVVGAGYVGLTTAACLASKGFKVVISEFD